MPLFETVLTAVGPAIAKIVLKVWAGDNTFASEGADSTVDALSKLIPEIRARNEAVRQLDAIGERAAESLMFTFEAEGKQLMIEDQEAVATLVAQILDHSKVDAALLVQKDLDPVRLAQHFIGEASEQLLLLPDHRVSLFTRIIEEASQSIIDIARVLPNFTERTFSELLKRERVLVDAAQKILDRLERIRTVVDDDLDSEAAKFETEYRRAVIRNLNRVELFGVDLSRTSRSHPLSVAYVSLDVGRSPATSGETLGGIEEHQTEQDEDCVSSVETALSESNRLIIRGPAGAGKTTLVHWIAVRAASRDFEHPLEDWNQALPFLIRLRQFGDSGLPRPEHFPSLIAPSISGTMPGGWAHRVLSSGSAVIMVDGVDEVAESRRAEVQKWLKEIVETFPKCRFIVTSRPHAVEEHWLARENFEDADLQPMDVAGIESFIDHWHLAVAEEVQREEEIGNLSRLAQNLKATLRAKRVIQRLATSPLLCSVICALHRDTNEQLPEDRIDLYERCCSMLLERRDSESGLDANWYVRLTYRQKRSLLDDLAYWMIKNDWSEVPLDSARDRFQRKVEAFRSGDRDGIQLTGENAMRFFLERSGILREPLEGRLDFAHRTFQEFMAATAAIAEGDIGVLLSNATNSQWREVVILGAGLARPLERTSLIRSLIRTGDESRDSRPQLHLLAAACLETAVDVDSDLRNEVENRIGNLFPPRNMSDAMQIAAAAGEIAIPFLRRGRRHQNSKQSAACVRALAMIGSSEAAHAIGEYAADYGIVLKEVVRASNRIDPAMFLDIIAPRLDLTRLPGDALAEMIAKFGCEAINGLEQARELSLSGSKALDLSVLAKVPNLVILSLAGPLVTDLRPLRRLRQLRQLILTGVGINDFSPLSNLPSLEYLRITQMSVDANDLLNARGLSSLSFWGGKVFNPDVLSGLRDLRTLCLLNSEVNLGFLRDLVGIRHLSLSPVGSAGVVHISGLHKLKSLYLSSCEINDFSWMTELQELQNLDLYNLKVSEISTLPGLRSIRKIGIKGDNVNRELVRAFRQKYPGARIVT